MAHSFFCFVVVVFFYISRCRADGSVAKRESSRLNHLGWKFLHNQIDISSWLNEEYATTYYCVIFFFVILRVIEMLVLIFFFRSLKFSFFKVL